MLLVNANGIKSGNNAAATFENGEPLHRGIPGGKSIWYTWTPPGTGIATLSTAGSSFDTVLAVYSGSTLPSLFPEASDEDGAGFYTSGRSFNVFAGMTYQIAIDGYDLPRTGRKLLGHSLFGDQHPRLRLVQH